MRKLVLVVLVTTLSGCSKVVQVKDTQPPAVTLVRAGADGEFDPVALVDFCALVFDEDPLDKLEINLMSDEDELVETGGELCQGGNWGGLITLSDNDHTLTVTATDKAGNKGQASVDITPTENKAPRCEFNEPENNSVHFLGDPVAFRGTVSDPDQDDQLTVKFKGSKSGVIFEGEPDVNDEVAFSFTGLTLGSHIINMSVIDQRGSADSCVRRVTIDPAPLDTDTDTETN
jgi:hypothetical protein